MRGITIQVINGQKFKLTHEPLGDQFPCWDYIRTKYWFVWKQLSNGIFDYRGNKKTRREAEKWMQEMATKERVK